MQFLQEQKTALRYYLYTPVLGFGLLRRSTTYIYGPTPFARHFDIDVRGNHCSHISGLFVEAFVFLALMVICAHTPHHPYGLFNGQCRWQVLSELV